MEELREMFYDELDSLQADVIERNEIIERLLDELEKYAGSDEIEEAEDRDG